MSGKDKSEHLTMSDGFLIFCRHWSASNETKRALVCIPGTGGNSEFFNPIGSALADEGTDVYGIDLRGFGNSVEQGLPRGDTSNFKRHLQDIDEIVQQIRGSAHRKVFMLGHSHGCAYTLWYAANHPHALDGIILASPPILATSKVHRSEYLKFALALIFKPKMMYSFSEEEIAELANNPLIARSVSIRWLYGSKKYLLDPLLKSAAQIQKPALILQGEADTNTLPEGARKLNEALGTKDKTIKIFPNADHFLYGAIFPSSSYGDPAKKQEVANEVNMWFRAH